MKLKDRPSPFILFYSCVRSILSLNNLFNIKYTSIAMLSLILVLILVYMEHSYCICDSNIILVYDHLL